ncbi:LCP family protein [Fusibacter bizertensis]
MKFYVKVFIISFIGFLAIFTGVLFAIDSIMDKPEIPITTVETTESTTETVAPDNGDNVGEDDQRTELEKIAENSSRINIIAFGLNSQLADTMMLFSYDPDLNRMDILSIPRDTYHHIEGYDDPGQKKLNATYGFKEIGGVNGMKKILSEFLGVPIDYYLKVDFEAVRAVVDTLGGYEVTVPFDMKYDDDYDNPPLHINLKQGYQVLNGTDSVKYLRWRKNSDGSRQEGDVQRIPRQQHFVSTMMSKALSSKLPSVINTIIGGKYVQTDMTLEEALSLAIKGASIKSEDIHFYMVEGKEKKIKGTSYWIHDPASLEKTLYGFYGFTIGEDSTIEPTSDAAQETTKKSN